MSEKDKETNVQTAWEEVNKENDFLKLIRENKIYKINSADLKKITKKEPRLITKFDCNKDRPKIFRDNNITIMSTAWREYSLIPSDLYSKIPKETEEVEVEQVDFNKEFLSINPFDIDSESKAINIATISGIFEKFLGGTDYHQTISGRMGAKPFDFSFHDNEGNIQFVQVDNPQMEIDGSLENDNEFVLIEAKNKTHSDLLIRQIYYPYRHFLNVFKKTKKTKPIRNIYMVYDGNNGVFTLHECIFKEIECIDSMEIIRTKKYKLVNTVLSKQYLIERIQNSNIHKSECYVTPPQANSLTKIQTLLKLCDLYVYKSDVRNAFLDFYSMDSRQFGYYYNACLYYNMITITKKNNSIYLELNIDLNNMLTEIVNHFVDDHFMNNILNQLLINGIPITIEYIENNFLECYTKKGGNKFSKSTIDRRINTTTIHLKAILDWCEIDYEYKEGTFTIK